MIGKKGTFMAESIYTFSNQTVRIIFRFTLSIPFKSIDTATDFEIYCLVYDRKGKLMAEEDRANCKFTWKFIGTAVPSDNRPHENYKNFQGNVIRGRINEPIPFVVEVTVSGAAAYDLTVRRGIMVCNSAVYM